MDAVEILVALTFVLPGQFTEFGGFLSEFADIADLDRHFAVDSVNVGHVEDGEIYMETAVRGKGQIFIRNRLARVAAVVHFDRLKRREAEGESCLWGIEGLVQLRLKSNDLFLEILGRDLCFQIA